MTTATKSGRILLIASVCIVAAAAGALLAARFGKSAQPVVLATGTVLTPPKRLPDFALVDHEGRAFTSQNLRGSWHIFFFGFTHCPDICPTTLSVLAGVNKALISAPNAQRPQMVFVTADTQRDTPERLKAYVQFFDRDFVAVTASQPAIEKFAASLGAPIAVQGEGDNYTVDHSGALFVTDPSGQLVAIFTGPHIGDALAADLRLLMGIER